MIHALIFAGGTGIRMSSRSKPKQFLELHSKPIIIYTLEPFEKHPEIDNIIVVCLESWIEELRYQIKKNFIHKVKAIVPGGETGHDSIYMGLTAMSEFAKEDDIVLIHDGVRPLISQEIVTANIKSVLTYGSAITASPALETIAKVEDAKTIVDVPERSQMYTDRAPQSFFFGRIFNAYKRAENVVPRSIDPSHLLTTQGSKDLHVVPCSRYNIKITEPQDYYVFRALFEAMENEQIGDI